jgi:hypothetical protein
MKKDKSIEIVDQSQNKITMKPFGISLESPKNIDIKAGAVLTLAGGTSLSSRSSFIIGEGRRRCKYFRSNCQVIRTGTY